MPYSVVDVSVILLMYAKSYITYIMSCDQQIEEDRKLKEQEKQQNKIQEVAKKENESKRLQQEKEQKKRMESFAKAKRGKLNIYNMLCRLIIYIIGMHVFYEII